MSASVTLDARQLLRDLESHWISLLLWLADQEGMTPDDLIAGLGAGALKASESYAREVARLGTVTPQFTVLHFVDFGNYVELAGQHRRALERIGQPPRDWTATLADENRRGCVRYRNHLSHGNRFDLLPPAERRQASDLFQAQLDHLRQWWPNCPFRSHAAMEEENPLRTALRLLDTEAKDAGAFAEVLGMRAFGNPLNLIPTGDTSDLTRALEGHVGGLHRVGEVVTPQGSVGLYLAYLYEWHARSSERERDRRRVARALVEHQTTDARWIAVLLDQNGESPEVEFILPRTRARGGVGTVRATVNLRDPSRYHLELLGELRIPPGALLPEIVRRWNDAFSVERVTKRFYGEFRALRDRLVDALLANNQDNPALVGRNRSDDKAFDLQLNAFGTRQLSRLLFLWFLQQKRWLGGHPGAGSPTYLIDLFRKHTGGGDGFFNDALLPIFFDGLGRPLHDERHQEVEERLGELPYLDGGLFRADADDFERELLGVGEDGDRLQRISLPDALFDPAKDVVATAGSARAPRDRTVLGLLRGYRFTTQESTPDDQSVDPDPELLGKVFENLYQEDDRHETGAYYTPREIVHYMCRQTLDGYLRDRATITRETIDWLRDEAIDWTVSNRRLSARDASALNEALDDVTVLDPAVGSGAFLVGMLHEITLLRRGIEQATEDQDVERSSLRVAQWKRQAITSNLYGVDINPMAVDICRLRLWLSLVIDLDVTSHGRIPPLPNLDFRIVAGDSLVDRMGVEPFEQSLPRTHVQLSLETGRQIAALQTLILSWQREFEDAGRTRRPERLYELAVKIRSAQLDVARIQVAEAIAQHEARARLLTADPKASQKARAAATGQVQSLQALHDRLTLDAPFQKPLLWPVVFPQVLDPQRGGHGFDIVVANPPYVRQESLDAIDQEAYRHAFPEVYSGTADLLVYFYGRALQVLSDGGWLAFITSNKYMRAAYGAKLREHLPASLQIHQVIDFGDLPVFDVAAYPSVVIGKKVASPDINATVGVADLVYPIRRQLADGTQPVNVENVRLALDGLPDLLSLAELPSYPQVLLRRDSWTLEDPALVRLFDRLMSTCASLAEYSQQRIYYGIKTGFNEAFVIDQATRDRLVTADARSEELLKPWLRGRDVKRWKVDWAGLYVIFSQRGIDIEGYPAVRDHLTQWRERLEPKQPGDPRSKPGRAPGQYRWFELQTNVAYAKEFEEPKVILPHFLSWAAFCFDADGFFTNNAASFCVVRRPSVAALLNSNVGWFVLSTMGTALQNGFTQLFVQFFERFPVPAAIRDGSHEADTLDQLVLRLPSSQDGSEDAVDDVVTALYDLTADERRALRLWAERKRVVAPSEALDEPESE